MELVDWLLVLEDESLLDELCDDDWLLVLDELASA